VQFRLVASVDEAIDLDRAPSAAGVRGDGSPRSMEVIANYTAFQQIRAVLGRTA
jgi:hypothetical protein